MNTKTRVLMLGASGMLGNSLLRYFAQSAGFTAIGTTRNGTVAAELRQRAGTDVVSGVDVENFTMLQAVVTDIKPDVLINCIGVVKQLSEADDPLTAIPINALLPHQLAKICKDIGARLVHVSTDCVFSGARGNYKEEDVPDAKDLYGRSKLLGETHYEHTVTLRTSIIGHELGSTHGLIEWFLSQRGSVRGYTRAIFSGLPTVELARVIRDFVIPDRQLRGLYHVAAAPIAKFDLLRMVAEIYGLEISIQPDDKLVVDRSLNASRFRERTGYIAPSWPELVRLMCDFR